MRKIAFILLMLVAAMVFASCAGGKPAPNVTQPKEQISQPTKEPDNLKEEVKQPAAEPDNSKPEGQQPEKEVKPPPESSTNNADNSPVSNKLYYKERAVVLTYHHISTKPVSSITIKPERFEADLRMLKDNGFNVISYRDMIKGMQGEVKFPQNAVVITFDDGYESFYKYAYPLLKKYGMPAINFVITSWTENYSPSGDELNSLGPDEIREMYKSGLIDIQSHSHSGHDYIVRNEKGQTGGLLAYQKYDSKTGTYESEKDYEARVYEDLTKSISVIGRYTDNTPDTFCFPFGHFNSRLVDIAKRAGFKYFVTTLYGYNKEKTKSIYIYRIRSGDAKLTTDKLKQNIIDCGRGVPVSP